jgi:NAD(P)-dependent dehydrogenase (short-subunit alcohol dehydrogenase family)
VADGPLDASIVPDNMADEKKVALVTGGGTGIGRASALALARLGFAVVVAGRRRGALDEVVNEAASFGAEMKAVTADVSHPGSVESLFSQIDTAFGRLDCVFNNAGVGAPPVGLEDLSYEQWAAVINTNLTGAFLCTQQAFRRMKTQQPEGGRIINNGSLAAYVPRPHSAPYTASKHGITGLTRTTALEGRPYRIACGQIDIGNAATDMSAMTTAQQRPGGAAGAEPRIDVEHVAEAVAYMAKLPLDTNVLFLTIMATTMPFVGRG